MLNRKPMSRSGFKRPAIERPPRAPLVPVTGCRGVYAPVGGEVAVSVPKEAPLQHAGYIAVVRKLNCIHCGIRGYTQFCHADMHKGGAIKSDCRLGYPGCGPHPSADGKATLPGCHWLIGTKRIYDKPRRHEIEIDFGRRTRATVLALGKWPKRLPLWEVPA